MKGQRQTIAESLLRLLEYGAGTTIDLTWAMTTTMAESVRRFRSLQNQSSLSPGKEFAAELREKRAAYKKYHVVLKRLHAQGLIVDSIKKGGRRWKLSGKGNDFLKNKEISVNTTAKLTTPGHLTIVAYDIPERLRQERTRLRELLLMMEFEQIQKSVWFANKKTTKKFVSLLQERRIVDFVHIFEVSKSGTIQHGGNI